jgi:DNA-binding CsgD family transcriptional regulator
MNMTEKEIAHNIGKAYNTVHNQTLKIRKKLNAVSNGELIAFAVRHNLT